MQDAVNLEHAEIFSRTSLSPRARFSAICIQCQRSRTRLTHVYSHSSSISMGWACFWSL